MGLVNSRPLFSLEWQEALSSVPESAMVAQVSIYTETKGAYDPDTDTTPTVKNVVYAGKARVQPLRTAGRREVPGDDTTVQSVLVSIPISENTIDFEVNVTLGQVTDAPLNPSLLDYVLVLKEIMDSSNPIERTLLFEVNQETRADG